jgi:hypothetical protein
MWLSVFVYRHGCVPDGKCDSISQHAKVWIDAWDDSDVANLAYGAPKRISGKYEIEFKGKILQGSFVAGKRDTYSTFRLCE